MKAWTNPSFHQINFNNDKLPLFSAPYPFVNHVPYAPPKARHS